MLKKMFDGLVLLTVVALTVMCFCAPCLTQEAAPVGTVVAAEAPAPVVTPAPAANPALAVPDEPSAKDLPEGLSRAQARRLGFTRLAAMRATMKLARDGELIDTTGLEGEELEAANADNREAIAAQIMFDHADEWKKVGADGDGRDWASFFEALAAFLERIMPLIQMLIEMFGGLSYAAPIPHVIGYMVPIVSMAA